MGAYNSIKLINKNPPLLCIRVQNTTILTSIHEMTTCNLFHSTSARVNPSQRNQSSKAIKEEKKAAQSIRFEPLIQSAVTAVYSPVTASLTFPSVDPSLSLHTPSVSLCSSLPLPFFPLLTLSSRSSPLLAPEQNEPQLHSGTLFLWQYEQASKSAGYCRANV